MTRRSIFPLVLSSSMVVSFFMGLSSLPEKIRYEIPHVRNVPTPGVKPITPFQVAEINRMKEIASALEVKRQKQRFMASQRKHSGIRMCARWQLKIERHPVVPNTVRVVPKPQGVVPCHAIGDDRLTWIKNGKDI